MPSVTARRLCPSLVFVKSRFDVYREVSQQIRAIFYEYTDLVEPLSLDEAYLDVTENKKGYRSAMLVAHQIRERIREATQLTASAGVSFNKFLAKTASDINKPDGMKVILPEEASDFIDQLPIKKFHGIGRVTADKMNRMGIYNGKDLKQYTEIELVQRFGKVGRHYFRIVRALDDRPVNPNRIRKSIGAERTFRDDLTRLPEMQEKLAYITRVVHDHTKRSDNYGRTVTLKIKTADFVILTRSRTYGQEVRSYQRLFNTAMELLRENWEEFERVRLLGVSVSNLQREQPWEGIQLTFDFEGDEEE